MTTTYGSVEEALKIGIYFSGRAEDLKLEDLEGKPGVIQGALGLLSPEMANLFDAAGLEKRHLSMLPILETSAVQPPVITEPDGFQYEDGRYNAVIYDVEARGKDGALHKAQLGITKFRDGYNLWLIDTETGMCIRT